MALGLPAINTPNQLELRAIQTAIGNARQRIEALERTTNTNASSAAAATSAAGSQTNGLRVLLAQLEARVTVLEGEIMPIDASDLQLAVRTFQPHTPAAPPARVDAHEDQIATRVFMPHVPLKADPLPQETATILAGQIFGD